MAENLNKREVFCSFNSLTSLVRGIIGEYSTIDLRDGSSVYGCIDVVDGCMNVTLCDAVFTDVLGNQFHNDLIFIRERQIRYVHIPESLDIMSTLMNGLESMRRKRDKKPAHTFKRKRAMIKQAETKALVEAMKEKKAQA